VKKRQVRLPAQRRITPEKNIKRKKGVLTEMSTQKKQADNLATLLRKRLSPPPYLRREKGREKSRTVPSWLETREDTRSKENERGGASCATLLALEKKKHQRKKISTLQGD